MHEPLKNITYLRKKLLFNFLGADFLTSKGGQRHEKQPLLGPAGIFNNDSYNNINFYFHFNLT